VSDERVRLFVALALPPEIRAALAGWRDHAVGALPGLRSVAPEALHVTLCFLGSRSASEVEAIAAACGSVGSLEPARLTIGDPAWLPARRPRVLSVSLNDLGERLARVQAQLSRELSAGGWYAPEARPFFAHVTVARARHAARVRPVELPSPPALEFVGSEVTLFRSRLSSRGARYEPLARAMLGSGGTVDPGGVGGPGGVAGPSDPLSVIRRFHEAQRRAYADGELDPLRELLDEDVVWHVPGRSAIAGEHRGVDAVLDYLRKRRAMTGATFRVSVHGLELIGDRVVQLAGGVAERDGRELSWDTVGVFRVLDGRIAECWLVPFDLYAFDEIWA